MVATLVLRHCTNYLTDHLGLSKEIGCFRGLHDTLADTSRRFYRCCAFFADVDSTFNIYRVWQPSISGWWPVIMVNFPLTRDEGWANT